MSLSAVLARVDADLDAALARLFDLVRIPSISADPAFARDVARAADWCAAELTALGFDASVRPTAGHPMVVAHWTGKTEKAGPRVLFYGHYDVQPVDPLDLWKTPPFEPAIVARPDGTKYIHGRGAADDKGQLLTFVEAVRAHLAVSGALPCPLTILLEGEEESGSPSLAAFLDGHKAELSKDVALICDTNMWNARTPAITASLRGLVGEEVTVAGADVDLHSGLYGGPALNPIRVLADILAGLHDADGTVTLPGFYDGVAELPADIKAAWENLGLTPESFLGPVGLSTPVGEVDRSLPEQLWARPTCEFNGISGGYAGEGFKTVLPARAQAKVSFRLVPGQDPEKIRAAFRAYVTANAPKDAKVSFKPHGGSPGLIMPFDNPLLVKAQGALSEEWGVRAEIIGGGGSIPIVGDFKRRLGMDSLLVGFGLDDDRVHSPNEKYELTSFHKGIRSWARILAAL
jgi:acetylornithine deacetylase/succinyl-diaminopimelate desuccinylase-like protein